jgi:hypothetical protein
MGFQRWQFGDAAVCNGECLVLEQQQSLESERILVCKLVNEVNVNVLQYVQCDSSIRQEGNVCQMNLSSITRNYRVVVTIYITLKVKDANTHALLRKLTFCVAS